MRTKPDVWIFLVDETRHWLIDLPEDTRMIGVYVADSSHVYICSMSPSVEAIFVGTVPVGGELDTPTHNDIEEADQLTEPFKYFSAYDFEGAPVIAEGVPMPENTMMARFPFNPEGGWDMEELADSWGEGREFYGALEESSQVAHENAPF